MSMSFNNLHSKIIILTVFTSILNSRKIHSYRILESKIHSKGGDHITTFPFLKSFNIIAILLYCLNIITFEYPCFSDEGFSL